MLTILLILGVITFLFYRIKVKNNTSTSSNGNEQEPVYNLISIDSPRVVGLKLLLIPKILRIPIIGDKIGLDFFKRKNNFDRVTTFASSLSKVNPLYYPVHVMSDGERTLHEDMIAESPLSIQELANQHTPYTKLDEVYGIFRYWTIHDFTSRYKSGQITPLDVAKIILQKVNELTEYLPLLVLVDEEDVIRQATESTRRYQQSLPMGVLDGVPVAVKDEVPVKGYPIKLGTSFRKDFVEEDCECIARLRNQGAMIVGKTNQIEMGLGTTGFNKFYGMPRNPHNFHHYTGGSSSGSAAAVASGLVPLAIGTDGGGSIRIPSALCGVVGLKPTFKRIAYASDGDSSVIAIGPIAGCLNDAALAYAIMAGPSNSNIQDNSHLQPKVHLHNYINAPKRLEGIRVGFFRAHVEDADPQIVNATMNTIDHLRNLGASVVEIEIPHLEEIHLSHVITILTEVYTCVHQYHNKYSNHYSGEVQVSLELGKSFSSHDFLAAQKIRSYAMSIVEELFNTQIDILISPATAMIAPHILNDVLVQGESNLTQTTGLMKYVVLGNFTGIPGLVIPPVDYDNDTNLPISILLQSSHWREDLLFRVAKACETVRPTGIKKPKLYIGGGLDGTFQLL